MTRRAPRRDVVAQKERVTRTGNRMGWVRITDASGSCEVTLFSEVLARSYDLLANGTSVMVTAELRQDGESLRDHGAGRGLAGSGRGKCRCRDRMWLARPRQCRTSAICWRGRRGKGRVILVPMLDARGRWRSRYRAASRSRHGWQRRCRDPRGSAGRGDLALLATIRTARLFRVCREPD